jgi:succinoglycan biosynthesis transport protein ExoP
MPGRDPSRSQSLRGAGGGPSAVDAADQPFFRLDLGRALQLHLRLALAIAAAGLALAGYEAWKMWPIYTAQSQVYIQPAAPKVLEQNSPSRWGSDANSYESFIQQQVQSATQPAVLKGALRKMEAGVWQQPGESDDAAADRLGKAIKPERVGSSYQVTITASAPTADAAAKVANAVAGSLIENVARQEKAGNTERIAMLREERERIQKELDADRAEQDTLSKQLGVAAVGAAVPDIYDSQTSQIRTELVKARTEHDEAAARLTAMGGREASSRAMDAAADDLIATDAGLNSLKSSLDQRRAVLVTQMANLTPNHPLYKQDAAELAQIDASLESNMKDLRAKASTRIQQRLRADLQRTAEVEGRLNAQLGQMAGAAAGATPKLQRANDLAHDILRLQSRFATVDDQLHNMMIEDSAPGAAFLSAAASPPLRPTLTGIERKALPLALGGIFLGLLTAVLLHKLDPRIYIAADMEQVLGHGPMAQLPDFDEVSDQVAEEHCLRLAAAIEHARQAAQLKSCLFTGAGPGAGTTTLLVRVGAMLQSMGSPAILVDAAGVPAPPAPASSSASDLHGSTSLVARQRESRPAALQQHVEEKTEKSGFYLSDTAPLSISAETEYLARFVDAAIVVVESGATTRAQLRALAATVQRLDISAVGYVLNRVGLKKADPAFRQAVREMESRGKGRRPLANARKERIRASFASVADYCDDLAASEPPAFAQVAPSTAQVAPRLDLPVSAAEPVAAARPSVPMTSEPIFRRETAAARMDEQFAAPPPVSAPRKEVAPPVPQAAQAETQIPAVAKPEAPGPAPRFEPEAAREPSRASAPDCFGARCQANAPLVRARSLSEPRWDLIPVPLSPPKDSAPVAESVVERKPVPVGTSASRLGSLKSLAGSVGLIQPRRNTELEKQAALPAAHLGGNGSRSPIAAEAMPEPAREPAPPRVAEKVREPIRPSARETLLRALGEEQQPPPPEPVREPAIPAAKPPRSAPAKVYPAEVTAIPEFLPPKPAASVSTKAASRRDRMDEDDGVQVLPSWRGQYRKRR